MKEWRNRILCDLSRNPILSRPMEYILAFLFSASTVLGAFFDREISFERMSRWRVLEWLLLSAALTEIVRRILRLLCNEMARTKERKAIAEEPSGTGVQGLKDGFLRGRPKACFLFSLGVILICWLPVWLAYWPGLWNYDPWQANQVLTGVYSKHHPLVHTLLLGSCYRLALGQGNANLAPILYTAIQGGICAAVYALCCTLIQQRTKGIAPFVLCLLFFAVFPVHPILAMSTTKDTLFSAMILLAGLIFFAIDGKTPEKQKWLLAAEVPVLALVVLFRNNAKYCFFLLIFCCLFMLKKRHWRRVLAVLTAGTVLGVAVDRALGKYLEATPVTMAEMFSVPSQMAGRVKVMEDMDEETAAFLEEFYSLHELKYNPFLADTTKSCLRLESMNDLLRYAGGSLRLFLKYPVISIDSFLYTTEGLWYIGDASHTRIYGTGHGQGYLMTDIQEGYQIVPDSKLPWLKDFLENQFSNNAFMQIPILHFLFAPALYVDLLLLTLCVMMSGRNRKRMILPTFLLFLVFTIALGPAILPRYVYPLMVCAPVLIWMMVKSAGNKAGDGTRCAD